MLAGIIKRFHNQYETVPIEPVIPFDARKGAGSTTCPTYHLIRLQKRAMEGYYTALDSNRKDRNLRCMKYLGK